MVAAFDPLRLRLALDVDRVDGVALDLVPGEDEASCVGCELGAAARGDARRR
jgi:hypothetical protein